MLKPSFVIGSYCAEVCGPYPAFSSSQIVALKILLPAVPSKPYVLWHVLTALGLPPIHVIRLALAVPAVLARCLQRLLRLALDGIIYIYKITVWPQNG